MSGISNVDDLSATQIGERFRLSWESEIAALRQNLTAHGQKRSAPPEG